MANVIKFNNPKHEKAKKAFDNCQDVDREYMEALNQFELKRKNGGTITKKDVDFLLSKMGASAEKHNELHNTLRETGYVSKEESAETEEMIKEEVNKAYHNGIEIHK